MTLGRNQGGTKVAEQCEYGTSEGAILRRTGQQLEVYRGAGQWAPYGDFNDWLTNTQIIPQDEADAAIKRFDELRA